jgi:hypothetical protein
MEFVPHRAAILLLNWGLRLPIDLASNLRDHERAEAPPTLPLPLPLAAAKENLVVLYGPLDKPLVLGRPKPVLGPIPHKVIRTLIEAGEDGLSLVDLRVESKHQGARNILKRIAATDPDWEYVIRFPGRRRLGGYRIGHPPRCHLAS